jgi:hypothetical protein
MNFRVKHTEKRTLTYIWNEPISLASRGELK